MNRSESKDLGGGFHKARIIWDHQVHFCPETTIVPRLARSPGTPKSQHATRFSKNKRCIQLEVALDIRVAWAELVIRLPRMYYQFFYFCATKTAKFLSLTLRALGNVKT